MSRYIVSGCGFELSDSLRLEDSWKIFQTNAPGERDFVLEEEEGPSRTFYGVSHTRFQNFSGRLLSVQSAAAAVDLNWSGGTVLSPEKTDAADLSLLIRQIFYVHAARRGVVQVHSSLVCWKGQGLMFLGPSGIGKTTQAELWSRFRGAVIINGDIVFVREKDGGFEACGSPWHGSSCYCENLAAPLKALVVLKQDPENSIQELKGMDKLAEVAGSIFYPQWTQSGMSRCLETLDRLLSELPVYKLACRPDEDAVRLTETAIFR